MSRITIRHAVLATTLVAAGSAAQASISTDSHPELLFALWDSAARVAYTLDLGIDANSFWAYAQQDAGYTWTYTLPASDPRLAAFRAASVISPTAFNVNQNWAVIGVQSNPSSSTPGDNKLYSTLRQGPSDGTLNPNYADMTGMASADFLFPTQRAGTRWFRDLNSVGGSEDPAMNTHNVPGNGSAFHRGGSPRYFANNTTIYAKLNPGADGSFYGGMFDVGNAVNKSSWFYQISNAASGNVVVDEFDNLSYNGYWGLALTSSNTYQLSYTLTAANVPKTSAATPEGSLRVLTTDYASAAGAARLIGVVTTVSAVPEPATWALFALGLLGLVAQARARRRDLSA